MNTNNLYSSQAELPLGGGTARRRPIPLDIPTLLAKPTYIKALDYVIQCGNFDHDKEIYIPLGIDPGNWTRIRKGEAALSYERESQIEDLCGNIGLTIWRAFRRGKGLHDLQDAKDALIEQQTKRIGELETEIRIGKQWLKEMGSRS